MKRVILQIKSILLALTLAAVISPAVIASDELQELASLSISASVPPYSAVTVSTNELSFSVLGTPGTYTSSDIVKLTVESNQSAWGVYAESSDLKHIKQGIPPLPADRLSFSVDNGEFKPLRNNVLFLKGTADKETRPVELRFQLTTTWSDTPGVYKGRVTISFLNNP
ncbi:MAG: hypothetical protein DSZ16_09235 [Candidatus Thioglobus sp.]|nr:MAG: hypothetical protein DSZ16_09235 [Candidatus Thioglobus sp.]